MSQEKKSPEEAILALLSDEVKIMKTVEETEESKKSEEDRLLWELCQQRVVTLIVLLKGMIISEIFLARLKEISVEASEMSLLPSFVSRLEKEGI